MDPVDEAILTLTRDLRQARAENDWLREDRRLLVIQRDRAEAQRDTLLAALRTIESGNVVSKWGVSPPLTKKQMRRIARTAISEYEGEK